MFYLADCSLFPMFCNSKFLNFSLWPSSGSGGFFPASIKLVIIYVFYNVLANDALMLVFYDAEVYFPVPLCFCSGCSCIHVARSQPKWMGPFVF